MFRVVRMREDCSALCFDVETLSALGNMIDAVPAQCQRCVDCLSDETAPFDLLWTFKGIPEGLMFDRHEEITAPSLERKHKPLGDLPVDAIEQWSGSSLIRLIHYTPFLFENREHTYPYTYSISRRFFFWSNPHVSWQKIEPWPYS